ncbi:hypothetical protein [Actinorugispora endophytica]|uniref:Uncharacterized protein n=1 Tax=Actinorugispora endophytica TaxID=1605990 RepID=A0A4V3D9B3_9ACTN|nr:hypothetical protein [Actinorugispora endophytica]TDQ55490.1 hypothetical protein EV190_101820 [Actinorugispora endophytica]
MNPIPMRSTGTLVRFLSSVAGLFRGAPPPCGRHVRVPGSVPRPIPLLAPAEGRSRTRPYAPVPFTPIPRARPVRPRAAMVRPYLLAAEHRRHASAYDLLAPAAAA